MTVAIKSEMFHKQYCLPKLLNLGALCESSLAHSVFDAASHPPIHPIFFLSQRFGILRLDYCHLHNTEECGVCREVQDKAQSLDGTLLIPVAQRIGCGVLIQHKAVCQ